MAINLPNKVRTFGSGYTTLKIFFPESFGSFSGLYDIAFCQQVSHTSPSPVAQPVAIQPLNAHRPVEIMAARAVSYGQLSLQIIELWNKPVWDQLRGFAGMNDLRTILGAVADRNNEIYIQTIVNPPANMGTPYSLTYHGCVVADIRDDDTADVTTMQINKQIDFWYRFCQYANRETDAVFV